jgi:alanine dehydrogenase
MIVKVKEPLSSEYKYFRPGLIIFTFLHLAADKPLTLALMEKKVVAIAYETVELPNGSLPLLTPMSEIAGCLSVQAGVTFLEKPQKGRGVLLGGGGWGSSGIGGHPRGRGGRNQRPEEGHRPWTSGDGHR